ncbi:hypothetical protein C5167_031866 [Papaver somniferum]|uniref:Uncharacterized protein n=1 Tax=Papaver somniferum TaxID=3469 RepID=A0A4Y7K5P2_PAPSO|nr:hypothetical protein C5167_031866 [Papaver somniferum]
MLNLHPLLYIEARAEHTQWQDWKMNCVIVMLEVPDKVLMPLVSPRCSQSTISEFRSDMVTLNYCDNKNPY